MGLALANMRLSRRTGVALATAGAACALLAPASADASFTLGACQGDAINGTGASFQNLAQGIWRGSSVWRSSGGCGSNAPAIGYTSASSGVGRTALGFGTTPSGTRDSNFRFAGADSAASTSQRQAIEAGLTSTTADDAKLHVIPVAVGAVTVVVNFPDNCWIPSGGADYYTTDSNDSAQHTARFSLDKTRFVKVFAEDGITTWGDLLPAITGTDAAACKAKQIIRVVRGGASTSGTSAGFQKWLNLIRPAGYPITFGATGGTPANDDRFWPGADANNSNLNTGETPGKFLRGDGNANVAAKINDNDGSIGYVELADARAAQFGVAPATGASVTQSMQGPNNDTFWIPTPNGSGTQTEPTSNTQSYKNGTAGANCDSTQFSVRPSLAAAPTGDLPAPRDGHRSLGDDWSLVDGLNSNSGYGICLPTFDLAFDDYAVAYGTGDEAKARTVKDYLTTVVGSTGQAVLPGADYSALPANLLAVAKDAVDTMDWNKSGAAVQNPSTQSPTQAAPAATTPSSQGTTPQGTPPVVTTPSNAFSFGSSKSSGTTGVVSLALTLPGPGKLTVSGKSTVPAKFTKVVTTAAKKKKKAKKITYGKTTVSVSAAGKVTVNVKPSSAAKKALKKGAKLKVSFQVTYTPTGGTAKTATKTVTVKGKKKK